VTADLGPDREITLGSTTILDLQTNVFNNELDTIIWNGSNLDSCENCRAQEIMPFFSEVYGVTVVDTAGCIGMDEVNIQVIKDRVVYIPNVFSPNGDGNNDRFFINTSEEAVEILELNIYNRWGAIIFANQNFAPNNPNLGWDGAFKGQPVNSGVFVYYASIRFIDGEVKTYSGDVTVMK
jgi:gliding motility-associated-like protein